MLSIDGWRALGKVTVLAVACLGSCPAADGEEVRVTVVAILATDQGKKVDQELQGIADEIRKKEPGLTGFRLGRMTRMPVNVGQKETFPLVDKEVAIVVVKHGANENNRVCLSVKPPQLGEITYTTCCGKFFPIVTRYQTKDKERLIIAIRVQPCKEK
jgi:hypothetical protein